MIAGRETIVDENVPRPIRPGDVLILVRRRKRLFHELLAALHEEGVPVAGADRIALTEHIAVRDLMAAGDAALFPEDDLTLATVLKGPLIGLGEAELFTLAYGRLDSLWESLEIRRDERDDFSAAYARIDSWRRSAGQARPYEFFSRILGRDGDGGRFLARLGPEARDAVKTFLEIALAYEETKIPSLQGFLHWMSERRMTVKARSRGEWRRGPRDDRFTARKGLEAPVVFLADSCGASLDALSRRFPVPGRAGRRGGSFVFHSNRNKATYVLPLLTARSNRKLS